MFKKFLSICALSLSFLVFMSPEAKASDCGCHEIGHKMHEAMEKLDLSKEQKDKIKEIKDKAHESLATKHHEMHDLVKAINESYKDGSINESKIDEFANKKMQILGAAIKIRMLERFEISKILTSEQKQKLNQMVHDWMEKHGKDHPKSCH